MELHTKTLAQKQGGAKRRPAFVRITTLQT